MQQTDSLSQVISTLQKGRRFLLVGHLRPDGDAIGSLAGLSCCLRKVGKQVEIGLVDPPPERFAFLLSGETVLKPDEIKLDYDAVLVLDSGDLPRTGFEEVLKQPAVAVINIDHHPSNTSFGDINHLDFKASSTCEMITTLIERAHFPLDRDVAKGLYLGLVTDTRFFQNDNLRPSAHHVAQKLLETGLDPGQIHGRLLATKKLSELKILGQGLLKLNIECEGRLAWVEITNQDLVTQGASMGDVFACGLFGQLTGLEGVIAGVGIVENSDGKIYCEFRSRRGFDVKEIAVAMGGGGHLAASGFNSASPLSEVREKVLQRTRESLSRFV